MHITSCIKSGANPFKTCPHGEEEKISTEEPNPKSLGLRARFDRRPGHEDANLCLGEIRRGRHFQREAIRQGRQSASIAKNDVNFNNNYFHEKFSIPKDRLVFVYLGILGQGRGIEHILDAFSSDEIKSHVVFMGFGEFSEKIESVAQLKPNVHLHEAVNHDQVVKLTSSASVGLCFIENISLSDYYCLPNKLFEYAFSGIPILASSFPDIKQCIEKYQLGYCSDVDSQSILEAIKKYEKTPTKLIDSDLYELSWECQSKRLVNSYKELLR